jgi:hypothetical protein
MIINFLKGFLLENPEISGSIVYNAAWLKFVKREQLLTHEQLDCMFTDALLVAHLQLIREEGVTMLKE